MIEIIVMILLARRIGNMALHKGLSVWRWRLYMIFSWLIGEILGVIVGMMIFGEADLISCMIVGIAGAVTGYLFLKNRLERIPDVINDDDINNIGS